jgi:hypothetical protein
VLSQDIWLEPSLSVNGSACAEESCICQWMGQVGGASVAGCFLELLRRFGIWMVCEDVGEDFVSHFCWKGAEERTLGLGVLGL